MALNPEPSGLLFRLSGELGKTAEYAAGSAEPTFFSNVGIIEDPVVGKAFHCEDNQLMAYRAPGNIYAERGTLSFYWRSSYPAGMTAFPVFRVSFCDHASWDHLFLRIDYNGQFQGLDAFVTDLGLSRIRVRTTMHPMPGPEEWVHIALSWDEAVGIKFYLNGELCEQKLEPHVLYAGLDQFGPHSRNICSYSVQSSANFIRGGDLSCLRIYDRMLKDAEVRALAAEHMKALPGEETEESFLPSDPESADTARETYLHRFGWDKKDGLPILEEGDITVRKIEIADAFDLKTRNWKSLDGIRETSWPFTFNRSRLPGRNDYFQLPDWNCYYDSGRKITYQMPEEPWNRIEIEGSAFGHLTVSESGGTGWTDTRKRYRARTFHPLKETVTGGAVRFENRMIEESINSFRAFYVSPWIKEISPVRQDVFVTDGGCGLPDRQDLPEETLSACRGGNTVNAGVPGVMAYISGRFLPEERRVLTVRKCRDQGAPEPLKQAALAADTGKGRRIRLPFFHLVLPYEAKPSDGLSAVRLSLPALETQEGGRICVNIQIMDPLWQFRTLLDYSCTVRAGEPKTLLLDIRDRMLPPDSALYMTLAFSAMDITSGDLRGTEVRLLYRPREEVLKEHLNDRFQQVRDNYGNLVEEHPGRPEYNLYNRFMADITDILRYDPDHDLAHRYLYDAILDLLKSKRSKGSPDVIEYETNGTLRGITVRPPVMPEPVIPDHAEPWAFYQVRMLKRFKDVTDWWIDHRMTENGELGGGLSDDGDQMQTWIALKALGFSEDRYYGTHDLQMQAYYDQGMFVNGLAMIQTDALHTYEDGIQMLTHSMMCRPWDPKHFERALETARAACRTVERNPYGELLFPSLYYSGLTASREDPWSITDVDAYLIFGPALQIARYNGNPYLKEVIVSLADTLLLHDHDGDIHARIEFKTGKDYHTNHTAWTNILRTAYDLTGDPKYLRPIRREDGRKLVRMARHPRSRYFDEAETARFDRQEDEVMYRREYINTEGYTWSDRVVINICDAQEQRLGGLMIERDFQTSMNVIEWRFEREEDGLSLGIMVPEAGRKAFRVVVSNMADREICCTLAGANVDPGVWTVKYGTDLDMDQEADTDIRESKLCFEQYTEVQVRFPAKVRTVMDFSLSEPGVPYHDRADLAVTAEDLVFTESGVLVTVHSLGAMDAPPCDLVLFDPEGNELDRAAVPALPAPRDLYPKRAVIPLSGNITPGCRIELDPERRLIEITRKNNVIAF